GVREDVVEERRLTGRLRPEHLDYAPAGYPTDAERQVERQGTRGNRGDLHLRSVVPHLHDRTGTEGALDLRESTLEGCLTRLGGLLLLLLHICDLLEFLRSQRRSRVGWILAPCIATTKPTPSGASFAAPQAGNRFPGSTPECS